MRRVHEAGLAVETYSPAEELFNRRRRTAGLVLAPLVLVSLLLIPSDLPARRFTLTWEEAVRIDWGLILLFGGGLAMGQLAFTTGLATRWARP